MNLTNANASQNFKFTIPSILTAEILSLLVCILSLKSDLVSCLHLHSIFTGKAHQGKKGHHPNESVGQSK